MANDNSLREILKKPSIQVYLMVLNGDISRFPHNFFSHDGIIDKVNVCVPLIRYMIEEVLKWNDDEICQNLSRKTFREYRLGGMLTHIFNDSPYEALNTAYPNRFKPWQLRSCTRNYWNEKNAIQATKWLIEEKLKLNDSDITSITVNTFKENGLSGMLHTCFRDSPAEAILKTYPDKFIIEGKKLTKK